MTSDATKSDDPPPQRTANQFMSPREVLEFTASGRRFTGDEPRRPLRDGLRRHGQYGTGQTAGRFYPIACVSLEVTQRCNLDCTLCYLSNAAEMAHDPPLAVLFSRIDMIASHYGPMTAVQVSGGDPTLRKIEELEAIFRRLNQKGMWSCLMTNGVKADRDMLRRLAAAGMKDVAFHVDLTQKRKGFATEEALNAVRLAYLDRAKGLGIRVLFNTTLYDGNIAELPMMARFFRDNADRITLASFQMQADTGRGVLRARDAGLTQQAVINGVAEGVGAPLDFDVTAVGHSACNRYTQILTAGGEAVSAMNEKALAHEVYAALEAVENRRHNYMQKWRALPRLALRRPGLMLRLAGYGLERLWRLRRGIWRARGRAHRLSLLIHNFMDAEKLERDRCESCVFMVMTDNGPLSMCVHNARRDHHLFTPARVEAPEGPRYWSAADGRTTATPTRAHPGPTPLKRMKGRDRATRLIEREARTRQGADASHSTNKEVP